MLIVGGVGGDGASQRVEVISPTLGAVKDCDIESLPMGRYHHTINNGTVCGGGQCYPMHCTRTSCITLQSDGGWNKSHTLQESRLIISSL